VVRSAMVLLKPLVLASSLRNSWSRDEIVFDSAARPSRVSWTWAGVVAVNVWARVRKLVASASVSIAAAVLARSPNASLTS